MYKQLAPYSDKGKNMVRTKQLKSIGEYIKAKLSEDELNTLLTFQSLYEE